MLSKELTDPEFLKLVNRHPHLKTRISSLLFIAEAASNEYIRADDIEIQLREHVRAIGQETFESWAISQERILATQMDIDSNFKKHTKKNSIGIQHLDK